MSLELCTVNKFIAQSIDNIGQDTFHFQLSQQLKQVIHFDSLVMMLYSDYALPDVIHDEIQELSYRAFQDVYLKGAYLLSPLYVGHRQRKYGFFTFEELSPEGFYQSEYYLSYYSKCGLKDQLILLIKINKQQTLAISLGLLSGKYSPKQQQSLTDLSSIIRAVVDKHWQLQQISPICSLQSRLQRSFDLFASSVLTLREQAVVQTLMRGHSSKSAAKELNISVDTERSYRKSAYAKLNINSQSELFHLLFSCLSYADQCIDQDPLHFLKK
jgi:DNA-binding CsgD family transcriptional regulator